MSVITIALKTWEDCKHGSTHHPSHNPLVCPRTNRMTEATQLNKGVSGPGRKVVWTPMKTQPKQKMSPSRSRLHGSTIKIYMYTHMHVYIMCIYIYIHLGHVQLSRPATRKLHVHYMEDPFPSAAHVTHTMYMILKRAKVLAAIRLAVP